MNNSNNTETQVNQSLKKFDFSASGELANIRSEVSIDPNNLLEIPFSELIHLAAREWWLEEYEPQPEDNNLEQVRGLLEAFYHSSQIEDWDSAKEILFIETKTSNPTELYNKLEICSYYQEVIYIFSTLINKDVYNGELQSLCTESLGCAFYEIGKYSDAIEYFKSCICINEELGNKRIVASSIGNIGNVFVSLGRIEEAIEYFHTALSIYEKFDYKDTEDKRNIAAILNGLGNSLYQKRLLEQSLNVYFNALDNNLKLDNHLGVAISLQNIGNIFKENRQYNTAIEYYKRSIIVYSEIGSQKGIADLLDNIGVVYYELGQYKLSINSHNEAKEKFVNISDEDGISNCLEHLGNSFNAINRHREAVDYYQKSLEIRQKIGDEKGVALSLGNLAATFNFMHEYDKSIEYYNFSIQLHQKFDNQYDTAVALFNMGKCLVSVNQTSQALSAFQAARTIFQEYGLHEYSEQCSNVIRSLINI